MSYRLLAIVLLSASAWAQREQARDALNRGVAEFKQARYAEAVTAFERAVQLDPSNTAPRLYLGTAWMIQWIPVANSPANEDIARRAEEAFRGALDIDSQEKTAIASLASLEFNRAKLIPSDPLHDVERKMHLDQAEGWYRRLLQGDGNDKMAYYSLGVIQWTRFYPALMNARSALGMRPEDPGPLRDAQMRARLRAEFGRTVEDGISDLNRAIAIDPEYADAMAYLNLLYRERADLQDTRADYKRDIETADEFVGKMLRARKRQPENSAWAPAPPPPPPPPAPGAERIRVGGTVMEANLITRVAAQYPPLARQARVQGVVRFSVIVAKDGTVQDVQLVSGHPLLVISALEAVKGYTYKPTLLNGQPVEVITQVDVSFTLEN